MYTHIRCQFIILKYFKQQISVAMVFITYKKTEKNSFAIECPHSTSNAHILHVLIEINNLRVYLDRLIWSIDELANKGVLKPSELQGVSWQDYEKHAHEFQHLPEEMKQYGQKPIVQPPYKFVVDKHHQRYGVIVPQEQRQGMLNAVAKARKVLQFKGQVVQRQQMVEAVETLRNSVMEAYPGYIDLPEWEPSLLMLEEKVQLDILETENFEVFDERATIWWAGKQLEPEKTIGQYVGKNEKTKVIIKVQKWGGQQPLREPPIDAETYQKMVKYYYKKVDEAKQLEKKSVQTHYEKVETKNLKASLHMGEDIRYKPF